MIKKIKTKIEREINLLEDIKRGRLQFNKNYLEGELTAYRDILYFIEKIRKEDQK